MKDMMEMMVDFRRVADHFGRAIRKGTRIGCTPKRISELKPLRVGTLLKNKYKVEKLLFWDGRDNRYLITNSFGMGGITDTSSQTSKTRGFMS